MQLRRLVASSIAIAAGLLAGGALPAAAATPTVVGKVTGKLPSSSRAATEIRVFEAGSASLVATATVNRKGAFKLALPPGGYVLATSITPETGRKNAAVQRVIPLTLAEGQRRGSVKIAKPTARSSTLVAPGARAAYTQESGGINPGKIAFSVEEFDGATGEFAVMNRGLAAVLQTDLVTTSCRTSEVANSSDRRRLEQEIDFEQSAYVDPSTRVVRNFIQPDIVVRGRLQTRGGNLGYALTLIDARTGRVLETISGSLPHDGFFEAEEALAKRVAKRLCAYGEVFEITFTGTGTANFATHSASGTLSADPITAKPTAKDAGGATKWEGSAPVSWTNVAIASKTDCSYADPVSGGTWTAKLERAGDALQIGWGGDSGSTGTATVVCPDGDGGEARIAGQATTALVGSEPNPFALPANGIQAITGGLKSDGDGWENTLEMKVKTIRVEPLA
jgi:hypothetical protein